MFPNSFSFHEAHGKHLNQEEIREMERQNQRLAARSHQYGDPVNRREKPATGQWPEVDHKGYAPGDNIRKRPLLIRFVTFLFSFF
jgi:hypothetical protein